MMSRAQMAARQIRDMQVEIASLLADLAESGIDMAAYRTAYAAYCAADDALAALLEVRRQDPEPAPGRTLGEIFELTSDPAPSHPDQQPKDPGSDATDHGMPSAMGDDDLLRLAGVVRVQGV